MATSEASPAKKEHFWFQQTAHAAAAAVVLGGGYLLLPGDKITYAGDAHPLVKLAHVGSVAVGVGTQFWNSFVVGVTLFRKLPRQTFGSVQAVMFPKYFKVTCGLSAVSFFTYFFTSAQGDAMFTIQKLVLGVGFLSNVLNYHTLEPEIDLMNKMYAIEKEHGISELAINPDLSEVRKDTAWAETRKKFMYYHGVSSLLNLVSFASNVWHLYYLSTRIML